MNMSELDWYKYSPLWGAIVVTFAEGMLRGRVGHHWHYDPNIAWLAFLGAALVFFATMMLLVLTLLVQLRRIECTSRLNKSYACCLNLAISTSIMIIVAAYKLYDSGSPLACMLWAGSIAFTAIALVFSIIMLNDILRFTLNIEDQKGV